MNRRSLAVVLLLASALPVQADTVLLKDGRRLQGRTSFEGDELVIRRKHGEVRIPRVDVMRIDKEDDVYSQHERKLKELGSGTSDERYQLGVWCRDHGLDSEARTAFLSVLKLDPDHPGARGALGYVRDDSGRWITEDDRMRLQGLVKFQGRWMTPADRVRAEAEIAERRAAARELARKAEEEKEAKRKAKLEEERAARLERIRAYEEELARARARRDAADEVGFGLGIQSYRVIGPYGLVGGACGPGWYGWGGRAIPYAFWSGPQLSNNELLAYAGWRTGRGYFWPGARPLYTGRTVTVGVRGQGWSRGGFYGSGLYGGGGGFYGSSYRTGWGVGVQLQGSYRSRNGRTQVRFRTGF